MKKTILKSVMTVLVALFSLNAKAEIVINGVYYYLNTNSKTASVVSGNTKYTGSVTIPSYVSYNGNNYSVTSIGESAFCYCSGLTSVVIGGGVTSIGGYAFSGCSGLTSVTIPNSVTSIGYAAFSGCSSLTSVTIPNSVTSIGSSAFSGSGLTSITVGSGNTVYDSRDNCNAVIETSTNKLIVGCKNTIIPNSVTSIGYRAFYGCSGLNDVTIPESVTSIGGYAFSGCSGLGSVTIPNSVTSIGSDAFYKCSGLTSVTIPNSVTSIGDEAFYECSGLTSVTIGNSVTSIGSDAFYKCSGLTSVTIPNSVTSIGSEAFYKCSGLTSIKVESGNTVYDSRDNCNAIIETSTNKIIVGCKNTIIPTGVTSIGSSAFYGCSGLTSVTIPESVTSIEPDAFRGSGLTSVTIPESVTSIESNAFTNTPWYSNQPSYVLVYVGNIAYKYKTPRGGTMPENTDITIKEGTVSISDGAFMDCSGLTSVTIPESVTSIGSSAFYGCSGLTSVTIPEGVTSIGDDAFYECSGLTSVTIPESVTSIGDRAFWYCNLNFPLYNSTIFFFLDGSYSGEFVIPDGIEKISAHAFNACTDLTSVTIPESVTSIGTNAFAGCSGLTDFYCYADNVPEADAPFERWNGYTNSDVRLRNIILHVPVASIEAYKAAEPWKNFGKIVTLPIDGIYYNLDDDTQTAEVISGNNQYTDAVVIPGSVMYGGVTYSVTSIGDYAFQNCSGLTSLTIPNSVTSIGEGAFQSCSGLTSVTIPGSVTSIGHFAFMGCNGLTDVTIPESVTSIGIQAFSGCGNLTSISVDQTNPIFDSREDCNAIIETATNTLVAGCADTSIPESVTSIGYAAFSGCSSLTSVTIPESVTSIESDAFRGSGLTSVTIPNSVTAIGIYAFYGCSSLTDVTIPESVTSIGYMAFGGCSGLTSVTIPEGVTSISPYAFSGCSGLTSVTIPKSVTSIDDYAFEGCRRLTDVYCHAIDVPLVTSYTFYDVTIENATLHVPAASIEAYRAARRWKNFGNIVALPEEIDGIYYKLDDDTQTAEVTYGDIKYRDAVVIPKSVMYEGTTYSVTSIGDYAFQNCGGLTFVTIPESVTYIGHCAFQNCYGLISVTIPEGVTIGHLAFMYCMGLTSVTLPDNLKEMSPDAFWYSNLKFPLYNSTTFFFLDGTYSGEIVIPDGIEKIAEHAFNNCRGLTSVTIPESVTSIGVNAFAGCSGLTDFYCYADNVPEADAPFERWWMDPQHTYTYTESEVDLENITLHVPAASIEAYKAAEPWKNFGKIVALSDVEIVPMEEDVEIAFDENIQEETDLTSVVIENVYVTLNTEGDDGYDTEEKCIVLISTVTDEQLDAIADKEVGDATVKENYNGLIIEVPAGNGTISITTQTKGACTLNVKIGDAEAQTFVQPERGVVEIPYTVDKDTYVYIYGASTASAKRRVAGSDTENGVLIYGIKWEGETTDIDPVVAADGGTYQIYTVDGTLVNTLQKGVNIIRYSDGQTKKVFIK